MQLLFSADVVVPIGVGVLVAVVAVIVLVVGLRRRAEDAPAPTDDDWTGEHVGEAVAPPTRTVADAVAARQRNPFLVGSPQRPRAAEANRNSGDRAVPLAAVGTGVCASVAEARQSRHAAHGVARAAAAPGASAPVADASRPTEAADRGDDGARPAFPADPLFGAGRFDQVGPDGDPWFTPPSLPRTPPVSGPGNSEHRPDADGGTGERPQAQPVNDGPQVVPAVHQEEVSMEGNAGAGAVGSPGVPRLVAGGGATPTGPASPPHPVTGGNAAPPAQAGRLADGHPLAEGGKAAGSSHSVAAAVAQVLAARAAAQAPDTDRRGDARDRLLAVLLDDPLRAVGAAVDLQDCQERIDRLTATLGDERGRLGDVLGRLACSGLRADQLARLSGLTDVEVAELLRRASDA